MKMWNFVAAITVGVSVAIAVSPMAARAEGDTTQPATMPTTQPTLQATDTDALRKLNGQEVVVVGDVAAVKDFSPRVLGITFKGNDKTGFTAVTFSDKFPAAHDYFDGSAGKKLAGQHVEISGKISLYHNRPEIILSDQGQVKVIDAAK